MIPSVPDEVACEIPDIAALDQAKVTDPALATVLLVGVYVKAFAPHIAGGVRVLVNAGVGFTVTVTVNVAPTQFPASPEVGVTV